MAADMIQRVKNPSKVVGVACRTVSELADTMETTQFLDYLSSGFRVITQTNTRRRGRATAFVTKSLRQKELDPRSFMIAMTDNIENKVVCGREAGTFESNTVVAYCSIPSSVLIADGFLNDEDPSKRLSRKSTHWKDLVVKSLSSSNPKAAMNQMLDQ